ncbi:hypothetical protein ICW40_20075 [Actinotalea ferrariae]|uniref:hypothetical protein n=1 Tax=Actinotalea ferrariae TaxID=1386098 RepID=UPI001C8CC844|nr:hypothetical protein [Actinotalea ferrariae]MBX9247093.1 hypothetical protein [Actinotalea ferrariae]
MNTRRRTRRSLAVALLVTGVAGLGIASAAQLSLGSASLGAGTDVVASCQPEGVPVGVSFTTAFAAGEYAVTEVTLSDVAAACAGQSARITLTAGDAPLAPELTGPVAAGSTAFTVPSGVSAAALDGVAVVIHS